MRAGGNTRVWIIRRWDLWGSAAGVPFTSILTEIGVLKHMRSLSGLKSRCTGRTEQVQVLGELGDGWAGASRKQTWCMERR